MRRQEPKSRWRVDVPVRLSVLFENALINPVTQKPHYGARSQLVEYLLTRYAEELGLRDKALSLKPLPPIHYFMT